MPQVQPRPERKPSFRLEEAPYAILALHRGEAMGLAPADDVDLERRIETFLDVLQEHRIGSAYVAHARSALANRDPVNEWFKRIFQALGNNPAPQHELRQLLEYFGDDALAELLQISATSVQRYARGERETPDHVIDRAHWLALIVGYLTGTYNEYGVRRWFERPRTALDGKSPKQTLLAETSWTSRDEGARRLEQLAQALIGMPAT